MKLVLLVCAAILLAKAAIAEPMDKLTFFTEQFPPYNMKVNGSKKGISVDLIREIFKTAEANKTIKDVHFVPWARGYQMALDKKNTVLFSTTRTENRENKFIWVGPIAATRIEIIGPAAAPNPKSLRDLYQSRIATIRDDVAEQVLLSQSFPETSIHSTSNLASIIALLENGRVDYWAYDINVAQYALRQQGIKTDYETKMVLKKSDLYYAFNPDSDPDAIAAFQAAFDKVKASGRHEDILAKYLK